MRKFFFIILCFCIFSNFSRAQTVYIDINSILNTSIVGISLNKYINKIVLDSKNKFNKIQEDILKKEKSIISKKNIIEKSEFDKKINDLSIEVNKFRTEKKLSNENIKKLKIENTKKILAELNPIITKYVDENEISLVIPKKNIIIGKKNLDITNEIIKLLNNKIKSLDF